MTSNQSTLGSLVPTMNLDQPLAPKNRDQAPAVNVSGYRFSWVLILAIFLITWFIIAVILYVWSPSFLHKKDQHGNPTSSIDTATLLIVSLVTAIIITFLIYVIFLIIAQQVRK